MAGIPTALQFADNTANEINYGSGSSINSLQALSLIFWFTPLSVANASRQIFGLSPFGSGAGFTIFQRVADGTQIRGQYSRTTAPQTVDTDTGGLAVNVPSCIMLGFDPAGSPVSYRGNLNSIMANVTTTVNVGSGTHTSGGTAYSGYAHGTFNSMAMRIHAIAIYNHILTLGEARRWQQHPRINSTYGLVSLWFPGRNGTGGVIDQSGNANHGTITGAIPVNAYLPRVA